jgi:hypothetical protein
MDLHRTAVPKQHVLQLLSATGPEPEAQSSSWRCHAPSADSLAFCIEEKLLGEVLFSVQNASIDPTAYMAELLGSGRKSYNHYRSHDLPRALY